MLSAAVCVLVVVVVVVVSMSNTSQAFDRILFCHLLTHAKRFAPLADTHTKKICDTFQHLSRQVLDSGVSLTLVLQIVQLKLPGIHVHSVRNQYGPNTEGSPDRGVR